jgi:hypothetical protein
LWLGLLPFFAWAGEKEACQAAAGQLLVGHVVTAPTFKHGTFKKGVELSHTHLTLRGDADGKRYDIAIDNVFADGYQKGLAKVPPPLNTIAVGDALELCGLPFAGGMHWVHNNCGDSPVPQDPNGWIKRLLPDGSAGPNLESSQTFCYLWPHH